MQCTFLPPFCFLALRMFHFVSRNETKAHLLQLDVTWFKFISVQYTGLSSLYFISVWFTLEETALSICFFCSFCRGFIFRDKLDMQQQHLALPKQIH